MPVLMTCFSYTPHASSSVSFTHPMLLLVGCFSCNPDNTSSEVSLLHTSVMLVLVKCFSCTPDDTSSEVLPHASLSEVFLLRTSF